MEWIPVAQPVFRKPDDPSLPPLNKMVLLSIDLHPGSLMTEDRFVVREGRRAKDDGHWRWVSPGMHHHIEHRGAKVIGWMPLPEPMTVSSTA